MKEFFDTRQPTVTFFQGANSIEFDQIDKPLQKSLQVIGNPAIGLNSFKKVSISLDLALNEFVGYDSFWNDLFEAFRKKIIKFLTIE